MGGGEEVEDIEREAEVKAVEQRDKGGGGGAVAADGGASA